MQFIREIRPYQSGIALEVVTESRFYVDKKGSVHGGGYTRNGWLILPDVTVDQWNKNGYKSFEGRSRPELIKTLLT